MPMKTEINKQVNQALKNCIILVITLLLGVSCEKNGSEDPVYDGKWVYESSTPEIDQSYFQSYIEIFQDRTFVIYDSSRSLTIEGGENKVTPNGLTITDPETNTTYTFKLLGKKDNKLTLRTAFFGPQTTLTLKLSGT